jgi:hypothetical protein
MTLRLSVWLGLLGLGCVWVSAPSPGRAAGCVASQSAANPGGEPLRLFYGVVRNDRGAALTLDLAGGEALTIDVSEARLAGRVHGEARGRTVAVLTVRGADGALFARSVARAKATASGWPSRCIDP